MSYPAYNFSCTCCGTCCHSKVPGDTVVLYTDDIILLSNHLKVTPDEFVSSHTSLYEYLLVRPRRTDSVKRLVLPCEGGCSFLEDNRCSVHDFKPFQCRAWPNLASIMSSKEELASPIDFCSGFASGDIVTSQEIKASIDTEGYLESQFFDEMKNPNSEILRWITVKEISKKFRIIISENEKVLTTELT